MWFIPLLHRPLKKNKKRKTGPSHLLLPTMSDSEIGGEPAIISLELVYKKHNSIEEIIELVLCDNRKRDKKAVKKRGIWI